MAQFTNPHLSNTRRNLWDFILWRMGFYADPQDLPRPPHDFAYPIDLAPLQQEMPSALWIGHSSFLISVGGLSILTDPIWSDYCSPVPLAALKRHTPPPMPLNSLPRIDCVLISHNHYDHLDAKTIRALHKSHPHIQWVVPKSLSPWFHRQGIRNVHELNWWESRTLLNLTLTAVPTQHFSGRTLWDSNKTGWNGYVVEAHNKTFYFVGDTGYNRADFKAIGERWQGFDLSLIPIGAYAPRKFMQTMHVNPTEAVQIHRDVKSRLSLGMHWKTFRLSEEPMHSPPYDLYLAMQEHKLPPSTFLPIDPGIYVNW